MSASKLESLNKFRAAEGKPALTAWKGARHQPMLDAYEAATPPRTEPVEPPREHYVELAKKMDLTQLGQDGVEEHCPHCGINLDNGVAHYADIVDSNPAHAKTMVSEWLCLGCGSEWGQAIQHTKGGPDRHTGTGLQIEKNRERKNGVTRPSAGGACRAVWDYLDGIHKGGKGAMPTAKMVREQAEKVGWNSNNASIEFYQWRKFMGITGRQK